MVVWIWGCRPGNWLFGGTLVRESACAASRTSGDIMGGAGANVGMNGSNVRLLRMESMGVLDGWV